jgi:ADP-heptose:LPS heptosyltransferase
MFCSIGGDAFEPSFESEKAILHQRMDKEYMKKLLKANSDLADCSFVICVNINAGELSLHRRWPKEYFAKVINQLIQRPNVGIILIGSTADVDYVSELKQGLTPSSRIVDVSGKTNIKQLIGLFSDSHLLITNDGGPLHLAVAVGLSTISFFGPETPFLYGPLDKGHYVFYEDLYCSPCLNIYNSKMPSCKNSVCLETIKPEMVLKVIQDNYLSQ